MDNQHTKTRKSSAPPGSLRRKRTHRREVFQQVVLNAGVDNDDPLQIKTVSAIRKLVLI